MHAQKIERDLVQTFDGPRPADTFGWDAVLTELCRPLDLARPVLLQKHLRELEQFNRTAFRPSDFMEDVSFDRFEIELIIEKKK